jgi:L-lysine 6-transaminase
MKKETVTFASPKRRATNTPRAGKPLATHGRISPAQVHSSLAKHMLIDGFDLVVDLERSQGSYLFDSRYNKRYLDFFSFFASAAVGINHPKVKSAEFLQKLARVAVNKVSNSDSYTVEMAEFVGTFERIAVPEYLSYAFFIEGGALGVENALKVAFDWKVRKNFAKGYREERGRQVIHFRRAFHGRTGYTMSMTNTDPVKTNYFPKFSWPRITCPAVTFPLNEKNLAQVKGQEAIAIQEVKKAIKDNPDDIAALIIEPIQGEGGDNHFRKEFFAELRTICDENDILLIFDEVQTGIGLTGKMWAHQHFVKPDLLAFGKKTQVCGMLCGTRIDDVKENVFHKSSRLNSTFGGNLVDMVRFTKVLEIIEEENLVENARVVGEHLLKELRNLEQEFPDLISNGRGLGLMCAIDLPTPEKRDELRKGCYNHGLVLLGCGERTIRFRPALNIKKEQIDEGVGIIRRALKGMSVGK